MGEITTEKKPKRKNKKNKSLRFVAVDVWQTHFGTISVRAIYDIYSQKFNVEPHNMRKYTFSHCVNALRKLENPDYKPAKDTIVVS